MSFRASWGLLKGDLRFIDHGAALKFIESRRDSIREPYFINVATITSIARTLDTSPAMGLKVSVRSSFSVVRHEFFLLHEIDAKSDLQIVSTLLAKLVIRHHAAQGRHNSRQDDTEKDSTIPACTNENETQVATGYAQPTDLLLADHSPKDNVDTPASAHSANEPELWRTSEVDGHASYDLDWKYIDEATDDDADYRNSYRNEDNSCDGLKAFEDLRCLLDFYERYV